ncbi:D-alanyl-D-alanine carboxypeptidase family protein [Sulfitobacter guttiformis KCTC 32187]|nr:D-alanyl-D-alanine carboxypeptidase family protein [Sulfitobacter guttiformis KCTC 32187]
MLVLVPMSAKAAPYAAYVIDARSGEVLHSSNAETRLHPASLTKMMTLYIAFQAIERGELSLDTQVKISNNAASEEPSKLGLKSGQTIALRYLIRAAAVKSANDAATAIGEAISGSEANFARRMNRTATQLGMTRTSFKNAHGLTEEGHLSTARDMTVLGRHLLYDYPQYYNLFSRITADAGIRQVSHTNRRFLNEYKGADGIKTGYTRAAGFNLTASAERGNERIIVTVFGGQSTASRNAKVAELMDLGFKRAPSSVKTNKPNAPAYIAQADVEEPSQGASATGGKGKTIRLIRAVSSSSRPKLRPGQDAPVLVAAAGTLDPISDVLTSAIEAAVAQAIEPTGATQVAALAQETPSAAQVVPGVSEGEIVLASADTSARPALRPTGLVVIGAKPAPPEQTAEQEVVTRVSTSGGRHWGVNVGRYPSHYAAEKILIKTALAEMATLDGTLRKVVRKPQGFDANFLGMSRETADLACRRLKARNVSCFMIGPS